MRSGAGFAAGGVPTTDAHMRSGAGFAAARSPPPAAAGGPHPGGWNSPVPYLFGGLAAMLGLIAFALLILACSYWKLAHYLDDGEEDRHVRGEGKPRDDDARHPPGYAAEQPVVVIMAGQEKPTYLATAVTGRATAGEGVGDVGGSGGDGSVETGHNHEQNQ